MASIGHNELNPHIKLHHSPTVFDLGVHHFSVTAVGPPASLTVRDTPSAPPGVDDEVPK